MALAPDAAAFAACPSCHTTDQATTMAAVTAGGDWRCRRCGQRWDADRLAAVAAYAAWESARAAS